MADTPRYTPEQLSILLRVAAGKLGRIAQVVASLSVPDRDTQLLMALQPFCGEHRRKKVEEAAQILRIIRLLPLLEDGKKEGP